MTNYRILLPPSEGKKDGGSRGKMSFRDKDLERARNELYDIVKRFLEESEDSEIGKLLGLKADKIHHYKETMLELHKAPVMKAIQRFDGVMFKSIGYEYLDESIKKRFDDSMMIIDGLFGIIRPDDMIPDYKLKMGSKLGNISVSRFWKENLKNALKEALRGKITIDLLPEEHRKAVEIPEESRIIRVRFCKLEDGRLKNVGHDSKKLKGDLFREICSYEDLDESVIEKYRHPEGFAYSETHSKDDGKIKDVVLLKD